MLNKPVIFAVTFPSRDPPPEFVQLLNVKYLSPSISTAWDLNLDQCFDSSQSADN